MVSHTFRRVVLVLVHEHTHTHTRTPPNITHADVFKLLPWLGMQPSHQKPSM